MPLATRSWRASSARALARPSFRKALQAEIPAAQSVGALDLRVYDSAA